ncbi:nuclear protein MDM1 isoform 4-T4 [Acanthopagrus schlegelii]
MTVHFKCRSEYQKSYRVSRSRSVSPQRCAPSAGLRSDQMGISREPGLQRRRRIGSGGLAQSCSSLLCPPEPPAHRTAPPAVKPHPSNPDSQPQLTRPVAAPDGQQPSANEVEHALRWRAGLKTGGQRSGSHRSEYNRQFSWKKPAAAASPMLKAQQLLHSSNRSVPPFRKNPVPVETEYRRSFRGLAPPTGPRLRKHLEHQRVPLFHTHMTNKNRKEVTEKKPLPPPDAPTPQKDEDTPPPPRPQVHRGHRMLTEYESSFRSPLNRILEEGGAADGAVPQVKVLRQQALLYRHRAWGANFSRDHLSQLQSEHNALWEPTDTTDSATDPPTPRLTFDLHHDPDSRHSSSTSSRVEALDLASRSGQSSRRSSVLGSAETNRNTQTKAHTAAGPPAERRSAWTGEEEDEENPDEEEGRLPTPRLKLLPVQRTHHDLTTPAAGGAILVGKVKSGDESSPSKQRSGSAVAMAAGAEPAVDVPLKPKEAWSENNSTHLSPSPNHKPANSSPASKPIRTKQSPPSPVAPPLIAPPPHGIQGSLRHADFQHNGELGLRFRERQCSGGGCGSDEDDRLSVMSWRSAASCSMASAVLERAQKRRENFWVKR